MASEYYTHTTFPATSSFGSSAQMRAELDLIDSGFAKLPTLSGNAGKFVLVNASANGQAVASTLSESGSTVTASTNLSVGAALSVGGAATLSSTLAVAGVATLTANPVLSSGTVNGVVYLNAGKAATSGSALTFDGANLGVGTVSPTERLHVAGALRVTGTQTTAGTGVYLDQTSGTGGVSVYGPDNATQGTFRIYTATANGGIGSTKLTLDATGNLGIGVASPATKLHVYNSSAATTDSNSLTLQSAYASGAYKRNGIVFTDIGNATVGNIYTQFAGSTVDLVFGSFYNNNYQTSDIMRLTGSGNLGIGTNSPAVKLEASSSSAGATVEVLRLSNPGVGANTQAQLKFFTASTNYGTITGGYGASAPQMIFDLPSASAGNYVWQITSTERMRLDSSGNVGIGQTAALTQLDIRQNTTYALGINSASRNYSWRIDPTSSDALVLGTRTTSSDLLWLSTSGNIGLGVTPAAWISNAKAIQVGSFLSAWTGSNGSANISFGAYEGVSVNTYRYLTTGDAPTMYSQLTGAHRWYTAPSGTAGNNITFTTAMTLDALGNLTVNAGTLGYGTGSGGTVTQATSRTTGVTLNKPNGAITLVSAAGTASWQSFTVTNSTVAATDVVRVVQASGTDLYQIHVTAVAAGSFRITFATTGGTTTEQPVFNFAVLKAVTA